MVHFGPKAAQTVSPDFHYEIKRTERPSASGKVFGGGSSSTFDDDGLDQVDASDASPEDEELFQKLRDLRTSIAREIGKPPYIVFSDKALRDMCRLRPVDDATFLAVNGVGQHKLEQYGPQFMGVISKFSARKGVNVVMGAAESDRRVSLP